MQLHLLLSSHRNGCGSQKQPQGGPHGSSQEDAREERLLARRTLNYEGVFVFNYNTSSFKVQKPHNEGYRSSRKANTSRRPATSSPPTTCQRPHLFALMLASIYLLVSPSVGHCRRGSPRTAPVAAPHPQRCGLEGTPLLGLPPLCVRRALACWALLAGIYRRRARCGCGAAAARTGHARRGGVGRAGETAGRPSSAGATAGGGAQRGAAHARGRAPRSAHGMQGAAHCPRARAGVTRGLLLCCQGVQERAAGERAARAAGRRLRAAACHVLAAAIGAGQGAGAHCGKLLLPLSLLLLLCCCCGGPTPAGALHLMYCDSHRKPSP